MALDGGIHHLGTKMIHDLPALLIIGVGLVLDNAVMMAFAAGMLVVLLFGNIRCRAPFYRWRVKDPGPRHEDDSR